MILTLPSPGLDMSALRQPESLIPHRCQLCHFERSTQCVVEKSIFISFLTRFLHSLRSVEMTEGMLRLVEFQGKAAAMAGGWYVLNGTLQAQYEPSAS